MTHGSAHQKKCDLLKFAVEIAKRVKKYNTFKCDATFSFGSFTHMLC